MKAKDYIGIIKESLKEKDRDYTTGSLKLSIVLLAIPMILELSLESIFAVVDMFFVGKLGRNAIAIVGYTESMITIIYSISIGVSTAATAIIARRIGEKDPKAASEAAAQTLLIGGILGIIVGLMASYYADDLLRLMGATDEAISEGTGFARVMFGGSIVILLLFLINGIFRGAGNAAIAMRSLWIASILNIILVPLMVYGIGPWAGFGLIGAAIATTIGRGAGVIYQVKHLFSKEGMILLDSKLFKPMKSTILNIVDIAWPATVQFIIASGSWIVMTKFVAEAGGTSASAGYQIAVRNLIFFLLPAWGLSNAAATLVGQNMGANQMDRAEQSVLLTAKYNAYFMAMVSVLFIFFARPIVGIFTNESEVLEIGARALRIIGFGFIFYGVGMILVQSLNGAGDTKTPTIINLVAFWMFQIPLAYYLTFKTSLGVDGSFMAVPIAETLLAILAYLAFKKGGWKKTTV
jgi:putative MATE family efflux protein